MTDFNQLEAPRFADGVRRLLGEDIQVATVAPELAPYMSLQADRPEWQVLFAETPWVSWRTLAATAGQFSAVGIRRATGSAGLLVVVTGVYIINQTAAPLNYRVGMAQFIAEDSSSAVASRDLRRLITGVVNNSRTQAGDQMASVVGLLVPVHSFQVVRVIWMLNALSAAVF